MQNYSEAAAGRHLRAAASFNLPFHKPFLVIFFASVLCATQSWIVYTKACRVVEIFGKLAHGAHAGSETLIRSALDITIRCELFHMPKFNFKLGLVTRFLATNVSTTHATQWKFFSPIPSQPIYSPEKDYRAHHALFSGI